MSNRYGPWATMIEVGGNPQLSTFWRRRLSKLAPASRTSVAVSRCNRLWLCAAATLLMSLPTLHFVMAEEGVGKPAPTKGSAETKPQGDFLYYGSVASFTDFTPNDHPSVSDMFLPLYLCSDLNRRDVRKELGLNDPQRKELAEIARSSRKRLMQVAEQTKKEAATLPLKERVAKAREYAASMTKESALVRKQVEKVLGAEQLASLRALAMGQNVVARLATDPDIGKSIGITEAQSQALARLIEDYQRQVIEIGKSIRAADEKTLAVVTPKQWAQLEVSARATDSGTSDECVYPGPELSELLREDVRKQLGVCAEQLAKVMEIWSEAQTRLMQETAASEGDSGGESTKKETKRLATLDRKIAQMMKEDRKRVESILTKEQAAALRKIVVRSDFLRSLDMAALSGTSPDGNKRVGVLGRIDLSPQQWTELDRLHEERERMMRRFCREYGERVLGLLTSQQQNRLIEELDRGIWDAFYAAGVSEGAVKPDDAKKPPNIGEKKSGKSPAENNANGDEKLLAEFNQLYSLKDGETWKRVAEPFVAGRAVYYRKTSPGQAEAIPEPPTMMYFFWVQANLKNCGMGFGGNDLFRPLASLAKIPPEEIEGDRNLLKSDDVKGDWIYRKGASKKETIADLERVLNDDCHLRVKLSLREVKRKVFVASGQYKFQPVAGATLGEGIYLYDQGLPADSSAGGATANFDEFLRSVGTFLRVRIVSDVKNPPVDNLSWYYSYSQPSALADKVDDRNVANVLKHVTEQTGITFKEETRVVPVLFIERTK